MRLLWFRTAHRRYDRAVTRAVHLLPAAPAARRTTTSQYETQPLSYQAYSQYDRQHTVDMIHSTQPIRYTAHRQNDTQLTTKAIHSTQPIRYTADTKHISSPTVSLGLMHSCLTSKGSISSAHPLVDQASGTLLTAAGDRAAMGGAPSLVDQASGTHLIAAGDRAAMGGAPFVSLTSMGQSKEKVQVNQ